MKKLFSNKYVLGALALLVTAALFMLGHKDNPGDAAGAILANGAIITLTDAEKSEFNESEQKLVLAMKKYANQLKEGVAKNVVSKEDLAGMLGGLKIDPSSDEAKTLKEELEDLKEKARKQGTTLQELGLKYNQIETGGKSIAEVMEESKEELRQVYNSRSGIKHFMINVNHKGEFVARAFDPTATKDAGPHATIAGVGGGGNTASIANSMTAATILRLAADAPIQSQYRNTPWIFDLCNLVNAGWDMPFAIWYDEQVKQGASATVAEGASKPLSQYAYTRRSADYKKEATLLGFTEEFNLDFTRLQSDILSKGRTDLINRINTAILANIITAATAYNTAASFGTRPAGNVNDWLALAAMAAQVDSVTFGSNANTAVMSTFKKYNLGTSQTDDKAWLNTPDVLSNLAMVGNPAMGADQVLVGDFKQYNILLRGGLIVRVGYNGTDFAENKFSVVMEQYYFDYISELRKAAIVKGETFTTVKTALTEA
jgi:Phage capsid family